MPRPPDELPAPLPALVAALTDAIVRLEPLGEAAADPLRHLRSTLEAVPAAAPVLSRSELLGLSPWRHELRDLVTAMTGWAVVWSIKRDEETGVRATEGIDRNARALARLLERPPG